jgi:hypothetical protein
VAYRHTAGERRQQRPGCIGEIRRGGEIDVADAVHADRRFSDLAGGPDERGDRVAQP